ncbi:hypothetical protein A3C94_03250 [Candidatus Kaiserbacteria bacterium RIFCSPHIGHO2_02_FULL_55_17]|uniref:Uncharacterized protein n=2 Tax=Candidatus Kaiseribacteriota TaxID=1752734 RepID=A0A1F6DTX8_9BACT|nr:MAG: hypothetical protein A3C94_03250 [Candidatus Kaiserbacteria bacterium RIFCSPHIGHO2_02_FULL_55_17]
MKRRLKKISAFLLMAIFMTSVFSFYGPHPVHAQGIDGVPTGDWVTRIKTGLTYIQTELIHALEVTGTAAEVAQQVNAYVLQPLAFVLSGNLIRALTGSVVAFVIGRANGTGVPQFIVDVQKSMQTVADGQALAFFNQLGRNSNSPFASSINSSLRNNYLSKTSLEGFWRSNMSMLARTSPNVNGYLAGRWSQGGVRAWFALTTRSSLDNPYTGFYNTQSALAAVVGPGAGGATGARKAEVDWGQGFMSWCSPEEGATANADAVYTEADANAAYQTCVDNGGTMESCQPAYESYQALIGQPRNTVQGVNPGDTCRKADGTPGTIRTPGSTIKATLDKVLGGQQDQIVRMGNVGPQINQILGNITTVLQTVQFASQILGGPGSGGLFGVDAPTATNSRPRLIQYQNTPGSLGTNYSNVYQNTTTVADMQARIAQYQTAWNTIAAAANTASASITALANSCPAQASAAQSAIFNDIAPVLVEAQTASSTAATAAATVGRVQSGPQTGSAYTADMQALQTMSPTIQEVGNAQQEAIVRGEATANPFGSLTISGGSIVDRMNLLNTNAQALSASCVGTAI